MRRGFTLIELLIVIAIIGILAALGIVSLSGARSKATDTQLKNNCSNLTTALAQYFQDNNNYPFDGGTVISVAGGATVAIGDADPATDEAIPPVSRYIGGGETASVYNHEGTDAKYISNSDGGNYFAMVWSLKSGSEEAANAGTGIYDIVSGGALNVPVISSVSFDFAGLSTSFDSTKAFVTYGPQ